MTPTQHIEHQIDQVDAKVSNILSLLKGNDLDKDDKGMIGIQNDHETRITRLERMVDKGKYFLIGMAIPAGWGMTDLISKLFLKH